MKTMEINAALWSLVSRENIPESAQKVVEYAMSIPIAGNNALTIIHEKKEKDGLTGMTEHGNVTLKEESAPQEVVTEFGITRARIGHFKVWRYADHIEFCHFWAADPTTEDSSGEGVETFYLAYDAGKRTATAFGVWKAQRIFSFWIVARYILSVETIWGETISKKGSRLHIG